MTFLDWLFGYRKPDTGYADAVACLAASDNPDDRKTAAIIGCMALGIDPFFAEGHVSTDAAKRLS